MSLPNATAEQVNQICSPRSLLAFQRLGLSKNDFIVEDQTDFAPDRERAKAVLSKRKMIVDERLQQAKDEFQRINKEGITQAEFELMGRIPSLALLVRQEPRKAPSASSFAQDSLRQNQIKQQKALETKNKMMIEEEKRQTQTLIKLKQADDQHVKIIDEQRAKEREHFQEKDKKISEKMKYIQQQKKEHEDELIRTSIKMRDELQSKMEKSKPAATSQLSESKSSMDGSTKLDKVREMLQLQTNERIKQSEKMLQRMDEKTIHIDEQKTKQAREIAQRNAEKEALIAQKLEKIQQDEFKRQQEVLKKIDEKEKKIQKALAEQQKERIEETTTHEKKYNSKLNEMRTSQQIKIEEKTKALEKKYEELEHKSQQLELTKGSRIRPGTSIEQLAEREAEFQAKREKAEQMKRREDYEQQLKRAEYAAKEKEIDALLESRKSQALSKVSVSQGRSQSASAFEMQGSQSISNSKLRVSQLDNFSKIIKKQPIVDKSKPIVARKTDQRSKQQHQEKINSLIQKQKQELMALMLKQQQDEQERMRIFRAQNGGAALTALHNQERAAAKKLFEELMEKHESEIKVETQRFKADVK